MSVPLVFAFAGGSGSGKTTVVRRSWTALGDTDVVVLEHDRYYRDHPELRLEERAALNYDHPNSLDTDLLVSHLRDLRAGRAVDIPAYDFLAVRQEGRADSHQARLGDHRRGHPDFHGQGAEVTDGREGVRGYGR
jgi:uridine kinase